MLSEANNQIGKLDGIALNLPDRDLFISKYVEKEDVVTTQNEDTKAAVSDVYQMKKIGFEKRKETEEIVNYIQLTKNTYNIWDSWFCNIQKFP